MKLTNKQETFAQNVAVKKMTLSDAYRDAYDAENMTDEVIWVKASELANDGKVTVRIEKLKEQLEEKLIYTAKMSFEKFQEIQNLALTPNGETGKIDLANAKDCEKEKAKLAGLYETKVDVTTKGQPIHDVDESVIKDWLDSLKGDE